MNLRLYALLSNRFHQLALELQSSLAGSGPTKAHRLHLKHVIRQFRAVEKRLASMLLKYTPAFLDLLAEMRDVMSITSEIIPCYSLLLEGPDGKQFPMETVRNLRTR